jgi:hypothetical protein
MHMAIAPFTSGNLDVGGLSLHYIDWVATVRRW